jgi:hypothetical protein
MQPVQVGYFSPSGSRSRYAKVLPFDHWWRFMRCNELLQCNRRAPSVQTSSRPRPTSSYMGNETCCCCSRMTLDAHTLVADQNLRAISWIFDLTGRSDQPVGGGHLCKKVRQKASGCCGSGCVTSGHPTTAVQISSGLGSMEDNRAVSDSVRSASEAESGAPSHSPVPLLSPGPGSAQVSVSELLGCSKVCAPATRTRVAKAEALPQSPTAPPPVDCACALFVLAG